MKSKIGSNPEAQQAWERLSENVEIYIGDGEQMSIQARAGGLPQNASDSETVCQQLSSTIAKLTSRPLTMHECGLRTVAGVTVLYVDYDGYVSGMRTMQFWLAKAPAQVLQFTLNCKDENVNTRKQELTDIVASVRWL